MQDRNYATRPKIGQEAFAIVTEKNFICYKIRSLMNMQFTRRFNRKVERASCNSF